MNISIFDLLDERKQFPLLRRSESDKYLDYKFRTTSDKIYLIIPRITLSPNEKRIREELFNGWHVFGVFDLSWIWKPYTSINFDLLVLHRNKPKKISFSKYFGLKTFTGRINIQHNGAIGEQTIDSEYKEYLIAIENFLNTDIAPLSASALKFWQIEYQLLNLDQLTTAYNEPELVDNESKLREETTVELEEIAQILKPRPLNNTEGKVIKTRDFIYPLQENKLSNDKTTSIKLEKGDILLSDSFSGQRKFYLISKRLSIDVYASSFLTVIRLSSSKVTPEYLLLYLQSDVVQKYFSRYARGLFQRVYSSDLRRLPVIIPDQITQNKSKSIFETKYLNRDENIIEKINKELFDDNTPTKPIQKEFILEGLENLKTYKHDVIERVIKGDLKELNICIEKKLYKSFLILSGSVLEAFLLDWLSEVENKDYFSPKEREVKLYDIINKLGVLQSSIFNQELTNKANNIRLKRNLIHPKKYFNSDENVNDQTCYQVINDLKEIISNRRI